MGKIYDWQGKHARYHLELETHVGKRYAITDELHKRKLNAVFLEGIGQNAKVETEARHAVLSEKKPSEKLPFGQEEKVPSLLLEAARHRADIWIGDYYSAGVNAESIVLALVAGMGISNLLQEWKQQKQRETSEQGNMSRRTFLGKLVKGALFGYATLKAPSVLSHLFSSKQVRLKDNKPATTILDQIDRQTLNRGTIKNRDELAATKMEYIARHYKENGQGFPNVGAVYGKFHAHIGQLVEDEEARNRVLERAKTNYDVGRMWKFHWSPEKKQWGVEEHHLFNLFKPPSK